eukprot:521148-Lingulodinium_polyedra.AAC.1
MAPRCVVPRCWHGAPCAWRRVGEDFFDHDKGDIERGDVVNEGDEIAAPRRTVAQLRRNVAVLLARSAPVA